MPKLVVAAPAGQQDSLTVATTRYASPSKAIALMDLVADQAGIESAPVPATAATTNARRSIGLSVMGCCLARPPIAQRTPA
jgi:hypothetical protein